MARKIRMTFLSILVFVAFLFASLYHGLFLDAFSGQDLPSFPISNPHTKPFLNHAIHENLTHRTTITRDHDQVSPSISTVSVLFPDWEVLVIVSPDTPLDSESKDEYVCLFSNNFTSPAIPSGKLSFPDRITFKCVFPPRSRRRLPFVQPVLMKSTDNPPERVSPSPEILRWNHIVYESLSTENDVFLFVKGVNNRQGINRAPTEFKCVFGDDVNNAVKTAVTTSMQEVFRCQRPELTAVSSSGHEEERIKVSLEISQTKQVVPSLAYYTPSRKIPIQHDKSLLCTSTMVYNVAKYLKEWVVYHSRIGVEKFILYDNGSDDKLNEVVEELVQEGYDVKTLFWLWPKTQEAGFSHSSIYANGSCRWMAYIDVDEFVYSPSWVNSSYPSKPMLQSLLSSNNSSSSSSSLSLKLHLSPSIGQIMIGCHEFGPSNQRSHPVIGVMQGYNCRRRFENRHKSIVLLDVIHDSLLNAIHHFTLKDGHRTKKLKVQDIVVNHYKFQAWPEFKAKFRRRVSAYVVDWMKQSNLHSNDRTPGLGFTPVEPKGWPHKFCEVYDNGLKELTRRWFRVESPSGYEMAWQR